MSRLTCPSRRKLGLYVRGPRKFLSEGSSIDKFFRGERDDPSTEYHNNWPIVGWPVDNGPKLNASLVAFVILQGIRTSIAKKPYNFFYFSGGWGRDTLSPPPLDSPMEYELRDKACSVGTFVI